MEVRCSILLFSTTNFYDGVPKLFPLDIPNWNLTGATGLHLKTTLMRTSAETVKLQIVKQQSDELKDSKNLVRDERNCKVRWKFSSQVTFFQLLIWKCSFWQLYHWYISTQIPPKQAIGLLKKKHGSGSLAYLHDSVHLPHSRASFSSVRKQSEVVPKWSAASVCSHSLAIR